MLLMLWAVCAALDSSCPTRDAGPFTLSVTSRRNETSHRVVSVNLEQEEPVAPEHNNKISLDVTHGRSLCGNTKRVHLATLVVALEPRQRRAHYELFPGLGYYKLHITGISWDDARVSCISEQAHLIVINSDLEADLVKEVFSRKPPFQGTTITTHVFVGIHDKYIEGQYVTVTGASLNSTGYSRWATSEPDGSPSQNFVGVQKEALMADITNPTKLGFICEQEF